MAMVKIIEDGGFMKKKIFAFFIALFMVSFISVKANSNTFINIDSPISSQKVSHYVNLQGWIMSTSNTTAKFYIDNQEIEVERTERQDVLNTIKGYGDGSTNSNPGFLKQIDISNYDYGSHSLKVEVYDNDSNMIQKATRNFIKESPKTQTYIDYPSVKQEFSDSLKIQGWVMSTINTTAKFYIDNQEIAVDRTERQDVLASIKGYGDKSTNPNPGFFKQIDITRYDYGTHQFKVEVYDMDNVLIQTTEREFKRSKPKTQIYIDFPTNNPEIAESMVIQGWIMSTINTTARFYIDNQEVDVSRVMRKDVLNSIKGYGDKSTNPNPGFFKKFTIKDLTYGVHNLKVEVYDAANVLIQTSSRKFVKGSPKTQIYIDYPTTNQDVADSLKIQGWIMSTISTTAKFFIDDQEIDVNRVMRKDVIKTIKGYGDSSTNSNPGFSGSFDLLDLSYGVHTFKVEVYDSEDKAISSMIRRFHKVIAKNDLYIDFPTDKEKIDDYVKISGWYLKSNSYSKLKMYVDDKEIPIEKYRFREDVFKVISGFSKTDNQNNGYEVIVDTTGFSYGTHTIKVQIIDNKDIVINEKIKNFTKTIPKTMVYIDSPTSSIEGNNLLLKGWYLTNTNNAKVELKIDNTKLTDFEFVERPDVYKVYGSEYGTKIAKPGFLLQYDGASLSDGIHTVTVSVISTNNNEVIKSQTKSFRFLKVKGKLTVDHLEQASKTEGYFLDGWEMSTENDSYIKVYLDNKEIDSEIERVVRPDVIKAIRGFGTKEENETPGFRTYLHVSNINIGSHKIKVELYSKYHDLLASITKKINLYSKEYIKEESSISRKYSVPYYNQYDNRWKDIPYGFSKFGPRGCAPTSMAMAFSGIKGLEILPNEIADYLYYSTREFNKDTKGSSGLAIIYATDHFGIKRSGVSSKEDLDRQLQEGKIVFAAMGPGIYGTNLWNHAIILLGYNDGNTFSYDPLHTTNNMWVSTSTIWSQKSMDPDDYRGGYVFYGLSSFY